VTDVTIRIELAVALLLELLVDALDHGVPSDELQEIVDGVSSLTPEISAPAKAVGRFVDVERVAFFTHTE
jgi:hypothetical protein